MRRLSVTTIQREIGTEKSRTEARVVLFGSVLSRIRPPPSPDVIKNCKSHWQANQAGENDDDLRVEIMANVPQEPQHGRHYESQ